MKKLVLILAVSIIALGLALFSSSLPGQPHPTSMAGTIPGMSYIVNRTDLNNNFLESMDLNGVDRIMIAAHQDDEALWGGYFLINYNFLVVHFSWPNVMSEYQDVLNFSQSVGLLAVGTKNWAELHLPAGQLEILNSLRTILDFKQWTQIVTHNPTGEAYHADHRLINRLVTQVAVELDLVSYLYFFDFLTGRGVEGLQRTMDDAMRDKVWQLVALYLNQAYLLDWVGYYFGYQAIYRADTIIQHWCTKCNAWKDTHKLTECGDKCFCGDFKRHSAEFCTCNRNFDCCGGNCNCRGSNALSIVGVSLGGLAILLHLGFLFNHIKNRKKHSN